MVDKNDPTGKEGMEVEVTPTGERKVTWHYTRKKNLKEANGEPRYESEEVGIFITDLVPDSEKNVLLWANKVSKDVMAVAKTEVWAALDLDFTFDEDGNPELDPELPPVSNTPPPNAMRQTPQPVGADHPSVTPPTATPSQQAGGVTLPSAHAPQPVFCKSCGEKDFFDNRAEQDAKLEAGQKLGPDWKCKKCSKGVFRPNSYDYNQSLG